MLVSKRERVHNVKNKPIHTRKRGHNIKSMVSLALRNTGNLTVFVVIE